MHWRTNEDLLIVETTDGTIYVWQLRTGHLDRVEIGPVAEDILSSVDFKIDCEFLGTDYQSPALKQAISAFTVQGSRRNTPCAVIFLINVKRIVTDIHQFLINKTSGIQGGLNPLERGSDMERSGTSTDGLGHSRDLSNITNVTSASQASAASPMALSPSQEDLFDSDESIPHGTASRHLRSVSDYPGAQRGGVKDAPATLMVPALQGHGGGHSRGLSWGSAAEMLHERVNKMSKLSLNTIKEGIRHIRGDKENKSSGYLNGDDPKRKRETNREKAPPDLQLIKSIFSAMLGWGLTPDMDEACMQIFGLTRASSVSAFCQQGYVICHFIA